MKSEKGLMKRFISYYRPHRKLFIMDLFAALILAGIELIYPAAATRIIDVYIPGNMINNIIATVGLLLGLYIVMAGLNYFMLYWGHMVGVRMEANMRSDFFCHLQRQPFKFFDENRTGNLMSRVVNDMNLVTELAHHGPEDIFISIVMFIGSFIVLFRIEWRLTAIIFLGVIPIMVWFSITQRKKMTKAFRELRERTADINSDLENSLAGIRVSKSFTNEEYESQKFNRGNDRFKNAKGFAFKMLGGFHAGMIFLISVLNVIVLGLGGFFAYKGFITIGELTGFLLYINLVMQPVHKLTNFTQQFEEGMSGFRRFHEIMNTEPDMQNGSKLLEGAPGDIIIDNITFSYNEDEKVLENLSLNIQKGTTVALVGPSGGGKTTLCHLIPRFYDVKSGGIHINGADIREYDLNSLRQKIGLVQQDVFLFTGSIRDNILYGRPDASEEDMVQAAKNANIHDFIIELPDQYDTYIGEKGIRLSGGQKQRISIARVFLKNPPVLLLDEATSALDNQTEIMIQRSLESLSRGRTTLVVAHRLSTIRNADIIVVLSDEGIIEMGTHEELYAKVESVYRKLYDAQFYAETHKGQLFA